MATRTNISAITNVPELFEQVLVELPFLDLVIATGVNKEFRDFIHSNSQTQRKLFLKPALLKKSKRRQKYMSKSGVFGIHLLHDKYETRCLKEFKKRRDVIICPFLLEPSRDKHSRIAYFTERALQLKGDIPGMYLTRPPSAHAHVFFTYSGVNDEGVEVRLEAGRSVYCRDGVTIAAISSALWQSGAIRISNDNGNGNGRSRKRGKKRYTRKVVENATIADERAKVEEQFGCKLVMDLDATQISL